MKLILRLFLRKNDEETGEGGRKWMGVGSGGEYWDLETDEQVLMHFLANPQVERPTGNERKRH